MKHLLMVVLLASAVICPGGYAAPRGTYSLGGGGTLPDPPTSGPAAPGGLFNQPPPTTLAVGPLPSFIYSTASSRFLLVLRRTNGAVVDTARTVVRHGTVLEGPIGEELRLDVIPLDGTAQAVFGIPAQAGATIAVALGAR